MPLVPLGVARAAPMECAAAPCAPAVEAPPGEHALGIVRDRDALLHVPRRRATPAPLLVLLHGARGEGRAMVRMLSPLAEERGIVLLAPQSRGRTWDLVLGHPGADAELLDAALAAASGRVAVDPARVALGGFSDGASYALSVGLERGGAPFSHLVAFSPGFATPRAVSGRPAVFVSHGTGDGILPVGLCSRRIVPRLRALGLDVTYREFDGGHAVPEDVASEAVSWWLAARPR